jgi:hypothetical protein
MPPSLAPMSISTQRDIIHLQGMWGWPFLRFCYEVQKGEVAVEEMRPLR